MSPLAIAERYIDAWNRHDASAIVDCFADGGTYTDPAAGALAGPAIADYADALFAAFPDLGFTIERLDAVCDDRVVVEWSMRGTNHGSFAGAPPTGREINLPGVDVISANGAGIQSIRGFFDQRTLVDQLGLQVIVQPHAIGPFTFGRATRVHAGSQATPEAISLTWIDVCSEQARETVIDSSRQIAVEMTRMPGFISWIGISLGSRLYTLTAWENASDVEGLMKNATHREAMKLAFLPEFASAMQTSVYSAHHLNTLWRRCPGCGKMVDTASERGACQCGAALPERPASV
jgi:steroid delta-isomerase-like uncharacterized protein